MEQERKPLAVGDVIHGFARGAFGRDHYDCVKINETGPDWIRGIDSEGKSSVYAEGYRDLVFLMKVRDEERCPAEMDGGVCSVDALIQLTDKGGFFRE